MTVAELISELQKQPEGRVVGVMYGAYVMPIDVAVYSAAPTQRAGVFLMCDDERDGAQWVVALDVKRKT